MPSPFPGMDPFIEGSRWTDFHTEYLTAIRAALVPLVRPRYVVEVEERILLDREPDGVGTFIRGDVVVQGAGGERPQDSVLHGAGTAVVDEPMTLTLPRLAQRRERFLTLRDYPTRSVVVVIELLSPTNKRAGGDGQRQYLEKRDAVLESDSHLVELDLLRGGERMPTLEPLPAGDFIVIVARSQTRPKADVYSRFLSQPLPTIPIPLAGDDPDVQLDLQTAFTAAYDRAGYDYSLDYQRPVEPPLGDAEVAWVRTILVESGILKAQ